MEQVEYLTTNPNLFNISFTDDETHGPILFLSTSLPDAYLCEEGIETNVGAS